MGELTARSIDAIAIAEVAPQRRARDLPEPFGNRLAGRERRILGDLFGLKNFGVNCTRLEPGAISSLRHSHSHQDEFIYVLEGTPILITDHGELPLAPGMCAGFEAGSGNAHHLVNRSGFDVVYLEVGDRTSGDVVTYPDDDVQAHLHADGRYRYSRKDGRPIG
jgi:uncharacterized cupin superfamily protein